jgi:hypothetical protein
VRPRRGAPAARVVAGKISMDRAAMKKQVAMEVIVLLC